MGTWEQPDIIVDESLQGLTAGFGQLTAGIAAGFDKRNAARAARKKAAAKKPSAPVVPVVKAKARPKQMDIFGLEGTNN